MILGNYTLWISRIEPEWCSECGAGPLRDAYNGLCEDCLARREELRAEERMNTNVMERMGE